MERKEGAEHAMRREKVSSELPWRGAHAAVTAHGQGGEVRAESPNVDPSPGRRKIGLWTDEKLEKALNAITDDGMKVRAASRMFGIPYSSLVNHLGKTTCR